MFIQPGSEHVGDLSIADQPRAGSNVGGTSITITPFNHTGWYSITISFDHACCQRLTTNYTLADSTNLPSGEPLVKTGDIFLAPKPQ